MATIDDLHKSISTLSDPELFQFIRDMRNRRRIFKKKVTQKRTSKAKPKKKAVDNIIEKMTQSQIKLLLKKLKGGD